MTVEGSALVFVGGLHRSGTTLLSQILGDDPAISGLQNTGVREDEGQHLQSVYPPAQRFGGPGRFAWNAKSHLTEASPLVSPENAARLIDSWSPYWDLSSPLLLEKSPPNLVMGRFLQALFPGSALVMVLRHPVVVALSTKKWAPRTSLKRLVAHWFAAYDTLWSDLPALERVYLQRYESLIADPEAELGSLSSFLGLAEPVETTRIQVSRSSQYEQIWESMRTGSLLARRSRHQIESEFGDRCAEFGYDVSDLRALAPWQHAGG